MQCILDNRLLIVPIISWFIAQSVKVVIKSIKSGFDLRYYLNDGGWPSAHSATVSALTSACGLYNGIESSEFAIALIFSAVVIKDALGVRQEVGRHATLLNRLQKNRSDCSASLSENVGHNIFQVIAGIVLGVGVALIYGLIYK